MRRKRLSLVRQITSSRQSPNRSPLSAGVDLVPLLDVAPVAVSSREDVLFAKFHLSITLLFSSSRSGSASHQIAKLHDGGTVPLIVAPALLKSPEMPPPATQYSAPRWRGSMSAARPRPGPSLAPEADGFVQYTCPLFAFLR